MEEMTERRTEERRTDVSRLNRRASVERLLEALTKRRTLIDRDVLEDDPFAERPSGR